MTFEVILHLIKNVRLLNVSIHRNFYQNRFINECAKKKKKKKKAKIPEFHSYFVRCRRTYVINNKRELYTMHNLFIVTKVLVHLKL